MKFGALALTAAIAMSSTAAFADEPAGSTPDGPMTSANPVAMHVITLPLRLVTGVAGAGLGTVVGGAKGIVETEKTFAGNTYAKAEENPMMVPVGLVGSVVAVPVGFVMGAPRGFVNWGRAGYSMWDRF